MDEKAEFQLYTGLDPKDGEVWDINKILNSGACSLKAISAKRNQDGYSFQVTGQNHDVRYLNIEILGYSALKYSIHDFPGYREYRLVYDNEVPKGELKILVSGVVLQISGPWSISWEPAGMTKEGIAPTKESTK